MESPNGDSPLNNHRVGIAYKKSCLLNSNSNDGRRVLLYKL